MEREYLVSFIIVLLVILVIGIIAYKFYPNLFGEVGTIAEDVFKFGEEGKKAEATQVSIGNLIESLAKCQKYKDSNCTCEISGKKKNKLPKDYRIILKFTKGSGGKPEILILAYSDEDKIIPVKANTQALKLEGLNLGIAYWGNCKDCGPALFAPQQDRYFSSKYPEYEAKDDYKGDIFCVFNSKATGNSEILIKGDKNGNWVFPYHITKGVLYDQATSEFGGYSFLIGNILKVGNNRYCLMTTNLERNKDNALAPQPASKGELVAVSPLPEFTSKDDVVKLFYGASTKFGLAETKVEGGSANPNIITETTRNFIVDSVESCEDLAIEKE